jgi:hypothetical protein
VNIKLSVHASSALSDGLGHLGLEHQRDRAMGRLHSSDGPITNISNVVDQGDTIITQAQSAYEATQIFSSAAEPIGQALQSLAQVVSVIDGLVEVSHDIDYWLCMYLIKFQAHPVAKAAWIVLSFVYKVV